MITLILPAALRPLAADRKSLQLPAATLDEVFRRLDAIAPLIRPQVLDDAGQVRPFVGLFVDGEQVSGLSDAPAQLTPGSQVMLVMAVAGG
ncbi:MAG TPA: MoaD/ThiS family protein [Telluria sp.]|nr:MoaD/ThiS family protein [Telluria sp.]